MNNINLDHLGALVAFSLLLMLVWRNIRSLETPKRKLFGFALIWLALFFVIVLLAGAFQGQSL